MNEGQNHVPSLILPKDPIPTLEQVVTDMRVGLRRQRLAAVGINIDPTELTDRDVARLVAAEQKRARRRARNIRALESSYVVLAVQP